MKKLRKIYKFLNKYIKRGCVNEKEKYYNNFIVFSDAYNLTNCKDKITESICCSEKSLATKLMAKYMKWKTLRQSQHHLKK